jgi:hypothetical protein
MNKAFNLIPIILLISHTQLDPIITIKNHGNNYLRKKTELITDTKKRNLDTSLLLKTSTEIFKTIKKRNYNKLASFIHPKYGVRFSPYAYIDTARSRILSPELFLKFVKQKKRINWHSPLSDTDTEFLTIDQYFKKYVYDVDFLNAPVKAINKFHSHGTDLNNIAEVYPECDVVEFYFPGFKKEYDGTDYRGLRFVFKLNNKIFYLIAIAHDEWTP